MYVLLDRIKIAIYGSTDVLESLIGDGIQRLAFNVSNPKPITLSLYFKHSALC